MHILITGSSGHLGLALSIVLAKSTHQVIGIDIQSSKYTHHIGFIANKAFVQECMQGVDVVCWGSRVSRIDFRKEALSC